MTAARIRDRIAFGYSKAASKLGEPHTLFRPTGPLTPALAPQNRMRDLPFVASESPDGSFKRPGKYGEAVSFGMFDARGAGDAVVRVGDYFVGSTGTWFVASLEQVVIPIVVQCTDILTMARDTGLDLPHEDNYSAHGDVGEGVILREWPGSVLMGGRTQESKADLPEGVALKGFLVLLPAWPGLFIKTSDRVTTANGLRFVVSAAELTDKGWRLDCASASVG